MFSIKSSFADCLSCPLLESNSCILETNSKENLSNVEVIFIAENPGKKEIKLEIPLIGRSGQLFRKYFNKYIKSKFKWLLTNVVLCATITDEDTTGNPDKDVIHRCKENCFRIIDICKPKLIVLMGTSPMIAFGLGESGITNMRGQFLKWNGYDVLITVHPSFVNRQKSYEDKFESDIKSAAEFLSGQKIENDNKITQVSSIAGVHYYKIPEKYYLSDYKLVDVQFLNKDTKVLYVFRDKDNNKIYHTEDDTYICYRPKENIEKRKVLKYEDLNQIKIPYKKKLSLDPESTYEGDLKITVKHAMDYYLQKENDEPEVPINILFTDIETYSNEMAFSGAEEARDQIVMITFKIHGKRTTFVVDPKYIVKGNNQTIEKIQDVDIIICNSEKDLLLKSIQFIRRVDPDILTGWNCIYENEDIWLNDRILKIKNVSENDILSKYGLIKRKVFSGKKKGNKINLSCGFNVTSSDMHKFPVSVIEKGKFVTKNLILDKVQDLTVNQIKKLSSKNNIYFTIDRKENKNKNYTYRDFLIENIDTFLNFKEFDISIIDKSIVDKIKNKDGIENIIPIREYFQRSEFFKFHGFSYKNLKDFIGKDDIINQLKNFDFCSIIIKNRRISLNLCQEISNDDLMLLGFTYTDGFWSKYDDICHYDNKDEECVKTYCNVINKYRKNKITNISKFFNKRDFLYSFNLGNYSNKFMLLMPLIYNRDRKKELNIEIISRLSNNQFYSFLTGIIDGDGSSSKNDISISCYENNKKDSYSIQKLLLWNNIFSYSYDSGVLIPKNNYNKKFVNHIKINHSKRKQILEDNRTCFEFKNSCSNNVKKLIYDDIIIVKLIDIEELDDEYEMYDIETESNYFICNGIKTHNCNYFDLPYIINRCKKVGIDSNSISKFGQVSFEMFSGYVDIAGIVCLDMIDLYKTFEQQKKESYSLNAISTSELKEGKLESSGMFPEIYRTDINRAIRYNIQDVDLLDSLNKKLRHIQLQDELRKICKASYRASRSPMGQLDSLLVSYLKEKGLSSQNAVINEKEDKFEGAFVKEPIVGIHDLIVDFDFTSLYPSIIRTLNIGVNTFCMKLKDFQLGYDFVYYPEKLPDEIDIIVNPVEKPVEVKVKKEVLLKKVKDSDLIYSINGCFFKKNEISFYSEVLEGLIQSRKEYKGKMFKAKKAGDSDKKELYNIRQLVYKVLSNALYGILGNKVFRFYNVDCARTITLTGQELLKTSIIEANQFVEYLKNGKHIRPEPLSKKEIYGELDRPTKHVITGDTDSIFVTYENIFTNKPELDIIQKYCDQIQGYLNQDLIQEIILKHNIDPKTNKLELKNELIVNRGLFVSKKHYVVNVICQEGVKTDEMVVMGLDTKRSDYPSYTKIKLKELFNIILKSEKFSYTTVDNYVKGVCDDFLRLINNGDKTVARPVSWGKKLKDYKSLPQGVRGMINWNELVYKVHDHGSKGYLFQIKGIDLEKAPKEIVDNFNKYFLASNKKLNVIVIPEDEPKLPDYFIIDSKSMLNFSWNDRYELLLNPLISFTKKTKQMSFEI